MGELPKNDLVKLVLKGEPFTMRHLHPGDKQRLRDFFYSHTPETIRQRYGYRLTEMTPERASQLVGVDQIHDVAYGIFEACPDGEIIHAVGRYFLDDDAQGCECAFVVRESKRRYGMGTLLIERLMDAARSHGLKRMWAQVAADNFAMLNLFKKYNAKVKPQGADSCVYVEMNLGHAE